MREMGRALNVKGTARVEVLRHDTTPSAPRLEEDQSPGMQSE